MDIAPFVEVSYAHPTEELTPSAFVPQDFYGSHVDLERLGRLRLGIGSMTHRMGRYGAGMPNVPGPVMAGGQHVH